MEWNSWILLIGILVGWAAVAHFCLTRLGVTEGKVRIGGCACSSGGGSCGANARKGGCCGS